jgi:hypothetical protein
MELPAAIDPAVLRDVNAIARRFAEGAPFRHVVIDGFLDRDFAQRLHDRFPDFARGDARNEDGVAGGKSVVERIKALGGPWLELDALVRSPAFLAHIERITCIPDLLHDPWYFGGGTHDNRHGQELDPHVDFNRHPVEDWHRRLNLIVYLNPQWDRTWGGALELHSDPRAPDNQVRTVDPLFNRCVIFETTETSWHGFARIELPPERRTLGRRSLALYFYTRERPAEETAAPHSTIYVDRPLPEHLRAGHLLSEDDVDELRTLLARRDQHNQRLYREVSARSLELEALRTALMGGRLRRWNYYARRLVARLRR